ncbi:unnamed protein product [Effrenium voratum]|uniref:Uncharacterized protein n=1 Tax=Effrenium voratum TaxID=2562239 RepID=A0AA36JR24_9DINO|nr:unnamed protein product [Effrenium voratum]
MAGFRWVLFAQAAAAAVASLFLDGHCSSLVNGVWEKDGELFRHGALTMRHGSDASNGSDGNSSGWVVELAGQILARGDLTSSTWEVWCGGTRSHAPLTVTPFSEAIFEISAEHCGEWLRFSRIADLPIYFARSRASGFFLFFNCTEIAQWQIAPEIAELAEIADADCVNASSPRPGTALASCDNELTSVELTQAAVSLELCGRRFLPSGHTMSGPLYRSENLFLYFEPACDSRSPPRWVVSSAPSTSDLSNLDGDGACNYMAWAESNLTTGPPRHGWTAWCSDPNVSFQGNLQLPLDAYIEAYQLEAETCAAPSVSDVDLADLAGGDANLVRRMLIYARGPDDIGKLVKEVDAGFVASQGWPFAAFFTFLPFVLFGVCSACHCCRCFRCYSKERRTARVGKIGFFVVLGLLILGASTCAGAAAAGLRTLEEANAASSCASAQLLRAVLQGAEEFVGLQPLLQHMESLLEPSPGRSNLLERTEVLEQSAQLAEATLQLLQDALDVDRLLRATDTRPDLLHRCRWCQTLADLTAEAAAELRQFLGQSKVATRRRFEGLFSASQAVRSAAGPVASLQRVAIEAFDFLSATRGRFWNDGHAVLSGILAAMVIALSGIFLLACASLALFAREPREVSILSLSGQYGCETSLCSCFSWFLFASFALFLFAVSGTTVVTYSQASGFCLVLENDIGTDLFRATGLRVAASQSLSSIVDISQQCLAKSAGHTGDLGNLDVLTLLKGADGTSVRETLASFELRNSSQPPDVTALQRAVRIPVDAQLLPSDGLRGHARYGAMELDARTRLGLSASVSCADFTEGGGVLGGGDPGRPGVPGRGAVFAGSQGQRAPGGLSLPRLLRRKCFVRREGPHPKRGWDLDECVLAETDTEDLHLGGVHFVPPGLRRPHRQGLRLPGARHRQHGRGAAGAGAGPSARQLCDPRAALATLHAGPVLQLRACLAQRGLGILLGWAHHAGRSLSDVPGLETCL